MRVVIALDAMGGDHAPQSVLMGAVLFLQRWKGDIHFLIYGDQRQLQPILKRVPSLQAVSTLIHTDEVVNGDIKPAVALRQLKRSSLRLAIEAVAKGEANAVISGGNTGAYAALAKILLGVIPGIERPALPAMIPSCSGTTIMLDAGANLQCDAENLFQFALMGDSLARCMLRNASPRVGILNVGSEDSKGHSFLQDVALRLRTLDDMTFVGFVEGDDLTKGHVDVIVTDGFTGNIALKTMEGAASFVSQLLRVSLKSSWRSRIGSFLASPAFRGVKHLLDPRHHNGTLFLGLRGLAVKSHGSMDALGFSHAVEVAVNLTLQGLIPAIEKRLGQRDQAVA